MRNASASIRNLPWLLFCHYTLFVKAAIDYCRVNKMPQNWVASLQPTRNYGYIIHAALRHRWRHYIRNRTPAAPFIIFYVWLLLFLNYATPIRPVCGDGTATIATFINLFSFNYETLTWRHVGNLLQRDNCFLFQRVLRLKEFPSISSISCCNIPYAPWWNWSLTSYIDLLTA